MQLSIISEIQHKYTTTNLNRNSVCGAYATAAINDLFHHIYGYDTHLKNHKAKKRPAKTTTTDIKDLSQ